MPTYEMPLLLRLSTKAEYTTALKTVANSIFETGGFIRKIENWGTKELPCKSVAHGKTHTHANHFMICFDISPSQVSKIDDDCKRNISVIRAKIFKPSESTKQECTLHEELLPPSYRPKLQKLLEEARKRKGAENKFKYNSSLDYYPFMR
ncbi:putative 28S ribosomal protein S6, mitochondrial [Eufriesea mexicana]|uniref:Small ribosomal subunit protein bS6m n=1 Tax=Eufriesea mexicana TaxID=516756 RepID=A0A310SEN0_9HYME|nr:PREDICTED: probable 28S ribosomal protein S6, mitochondrial [Eufriesea mexicana]OAD59717.1 putative 28S ribosomal protein S6, mitochondrial [Eufriesea mexicana]